MDSGDHESSILNTAVSSDIPKSATAQTTIKDNEYYKMDHKKQGVAYIFNHQFFGDKKNTERSGTDVDGKRLANCLIALKFEVNSFKDLRKREIEEHINRATKFDYSNYNCLFVAILSHGDHDKLSAYDCNYDPNEIILSQFTGDKCPTLAGKPKLFLLQACQGDKLDPGVKVEHRFYSTEFDNKSTNVCQTYSLPIYADFLIMLPTARGYFAFRNNTEGSYYLKVFCEEVQNSAYEKDFYAILTKINQRVALEFESKAKDPKQYGKKQIPNFRSSLTKLLKFVDIRDNE